MGQEAVIEEIREIIDHGYEDDFDCICDLVTVLDKHLCEGKTPPKDWLSAFRIKGSSQMEDAKKEVVLYGYTFNVNTHEGAVLMMEAGIQFKYVKMEKGVHPSNKKEPPEEFRISPTIVDDEGVVHEGMEKLREYVKEYKMRKESKNEG
jgi:hypothetical protein